MIEGMPSEAPALAVVIATHGRAWLLERTLEHLAACRRQPTFEGVWVVENGSRGAAEQICGTFSSRFPIHYLHHAEANKSLALNLALTELKVDAVLFLDDDVRVREDILLVYARALETYGRGHFFGGRVDVDYEAPPPPWLAPHLPWSVLGYAPLEHEGILDRPTFLGANWCAYREDIVARGGFARHLGAGQHQAMGEETQLQRLLHAAGMHPIYLPEAVVWHYVPRDRCSIQWALSRSYRAGIGDGIRFAEAPRAGLGVRAIWRDLCLPALKKLIVVIWQYASFAPIERRTVARLRLYEGVGMLVGFGRTRRTRAWKT